MKRLALFALPESINRPVLFGDPSKNIYGFQLPSGDRGWIEESDYDSETFTLRCVQDIHKRNCWKDTGLSEDEATEWLKAQDATIYRFDTSQELLRWLSQEK